MTSAMPSPPHAWALCRELDAAVAQALHYLQHLTPEALAAIDVIYAADAEFADPFQTVQGVAAVRAIYAHMFEALQAPRFEVTECVRQAAVAYVRWIFHFSRAGRPMRIEGVSRLAWAQQADGGWRIAAHRDDWDAADQVYAHVPVLGAVLRALKRRLATPQPPQA